MADDAAANLHLAVEVDDGLAVGDLGDDPDGVGRPVDEAAAAGAVQKAVESAAAHRRRIPVRCGDLGALVERPLEPARAVPSALTVLRRKSLTT